MDRVYCTKSKDKGFIAGQIYKIEEGRIIDKDGVPRPCFIKKGTIPITSIDDIRYYKGKEWDWIGVFAEIQ